MKHIEINGRKIGPGEPVYIVAEMSANHGQDYDRAVEIVKAAKRAGADAIKLQTYTADTMTIDCDNEHFKIKGTPWNGRTLYDLYSEGAMPWEWQPRLFELAREIRIDCFSTPFDCTAVDFLEEWNCPAYKVASFEIGDTPLLDRIARTGKPVIVSSGEASLLQVEYAVHVFDSLAFLKCTSSYPAPPFSMNLRAMQSLGHIFGVPVGLSDHSLGIAAPIVATALGACIIEKHFNPVPYAVTLDGSFSLNFDQFKAMVEAVHQAEEMMGEEAWISGWSSPFCRSLFVVEDVKAGEVLTEKNVRAIRPGFGLPPRFLDMILYRVAACDIERGTPLGWEHVGT